MNVNKLKSCILRQSVFCSEDKGFKALVLLPIQEVTNMPPSRPLTPTEQIDIMLAIESEDMCEADVSSERDEEVRSDRLFISCI